MPEDSPQEQSLTFHLIKAPGYETHHADGAIGGLTPTGGAFLSFFVERGAIPQTLTHQIEESGKLGEVIGTSGRAGIVREIQTGIILDKRRLENLIKHMQSMLKQMEEAAADQENEKNQSS